MHNHFSQTGENLLEKQVEPLFKMTLFGGSANIFSSFLIVLFIYNSPQEFYSYFLSAAITILSVIRIVISNHHLKKNTYKLNTYLNAYLLFTCLVGIVWGLYAFIQVFYNDASLRSLVFLVNFGLIAGSIATLSTWMRAYLAYVIPQALAICYVFITLDNGYNLQITTAFIIFTGIMIVTSYRFNTRFISELKLRYKNRSLIIDLNQEIINRKLAQEELEHNKHDLEIKVRERTSELIEINTNLENVIKKKEHAEESLQYLAYHDELTGLPNRNLLVDRINQSIKISAREDQKMAILFLDLDRFKNINDSLGHTIGDTLLKVVAARLYTTLRSHDTVSRNGGDEFVVVLEKLKNSDEAIHVAKKIISCLTETFDIQSHQIHIGASIGISIFPNDGETPLTLLKNADTAMYRAKQKGGNQLQFYDKSMSNQLSDRLDIESELHNALENNEFYLVYQPQINCITGETTGFESLIRWNNKKHGEIKPNRFIPLLEETGLIYSVGYWVVTQVTNFINTNKKYSARVSINLSTLQCNKFSFIAFVKSEINRTGINPAQIEFEITESLLINDFEKTNIFLNKLHAIGCTISLDDFGTGYTSMNYLTRLPIDTIKIDKSLVHNIDTNDNLKSIVTAIVTMSKSLGKKNIFEGVETKAELDIIKNMGGTIIQGFLFSKPLKTVEIDKWLTLAALDK